MVNHLKGRIELLLKDKMQPELLRNFADAFVRVRKNVHMDIPYYVYHIYSKFLS